MRSRFAPVVVTAFLLLALPVHANKAGNALAPADRALAAGDYPRAWQAYRRHAATNALAQFNLGLFEQHGWGRAVNPAAACTWFEKAAHGHIPAAQQFLGDCLAGSIGRPVDGPGAVQWYRAAATSGIAWAGCAAGQLYLTGAIVPRDVSQGLALCTTAAQAQSVPAMMVLADGYRIGIQVPASPALVRYWYTQAAERHQREAQWHLGLMLGEGAGGPADLVQAR